MLCSLFVFFFCILMLLRKVIKLLFEFLLVLKWLTMGLIFTGLGDLYRHQQIWSAKGEEFSKGPRFSKHFQELQIKYLNFFSFCKQKMPFDRLWKSEKKTVWTDWNQEIIFNENWIMMCKQSNWNKTNATHSDVGMKRMWWH